MNKKKSRKGRIFLILIVILIAAGGIAAAWYLKQKEEGEVSVGTYKTGTVKKGTVSTGISESGTVAFGTKEQIFSVAEITEVSVSSSDDSTGSSDASSSAGGNAGKTEQSVQMPGGTQEMNMGMNGMGTFVSTSASGESSGEETSLVVEEMYIAAGQVVQEGDKILKITEDSISEYREQLNAAVKSASLQVSKEEINVESKKAEADYTYQMYLAEGETAEETYQATITSLETAVSDLEEELEEADDEDEIEELEAELKIAKNNLTTQSIEAKQTYEKAMTNYKYAQQLYEIDTNGLEDDLTDAWETLEEAQQNLEDFEGQIGDGFIYAEYSGTVTEVYCAAGDTLTNDAAAAVFLDSDDVTMTVSVSQEDISGISTGDTASISLTAYEDEVFEGEVSSISTSASTGSSTVSYDVAVRFTGDISKVYSGMTGEVTFQGTMITDTLYISNRAVYQEGTHSYVRVLNEDGSIAQTEIKTGFSNGSVVAVESGLEEGQQVIIESKVIQ